MTSLVIRGGTIIDGKHGDPFEANIANSNGNIMGIGRCLPEGTEELDAYRKFVTPGFVDPHTHYDSQIT